MFIVSIFAGFSDRLNRFSGQTIRSESTDRSSLCRAIAARTFPITGACIWNGLPADVTSVPSLIVFRQRLKTVLFRRSYQNFIVSLAVSLRCIIFRLL